MGGYSDWASSMARQEKEDRQAYENWKNASGMPMPSKGDRTKINRHMSKDKN